MFGPDLSSLSDDDLLERQNEINRKIVWAARFSSSEMVEQLRIHLRSLDFERRERAGRARAVQLAAQPPVVCETDPDLSRVHKEAFEAATAQENSKSSSRARPITITRERVRPTLRPGAD